MVYLDASVVFSLYVSDSNTVEASHLVTSATETLLISALCEMETINAFALRIFRREMTAGNMDIALRDLDSDLRAGFLQSISFPESAFIRAKTLSKKITPTVGVRGADLLHIAAALELGAKSLYIFDLRQHQAAQAIGLKVNQLPNP